MCSVQFCINTSKKEYNDMEKVRNKKIALIGSTGSIGTQAVEVCQKHGIEITAITGGKNTSLLEEQARRIKPKYVAVAYDKEYADIKTRLADTNITVLCGSEGISEIASMTENDIVLNSVVGVVGLQYTLSAVEAGIDVALANKESLVAGGELVMKRAKEKGVTIYPVDSEHSAIFQCLQGNKREQLNKIILTCSGGPFIDYTPAQMKAVTLADALAHPNWNMGHKITIDCSTLMNKGLEFIEAKWLFDLDPEQIEVVIHRQSVIHSAVEYKDCAVIAQLGVPDMKIPIQYALLYPERLECPTKPLSLTDYGTLTFEKPDLERFPCLAVAIEAIKRGGGYPALMCSANDYAVRAFLEGRIEFCQIADIAQSMLRDRGEFAISSLDDIMQIYKTAEDEVEAQIKTCSHR